MTPQNVLTPMAELQARVAQEAERELRMAVDTGAPATKRDAQGIEVLRADIRQFAALQGAPDQFDGIQLRRIARQPLDREPCSLSSEVRAHHATLVRRQTVPTAADRREQARRDVDWDGCDVGPQP